MSLRAVLLSGLRLSSNLRPLLPLYLVAALFALVQGWPLALALSGGALYNPFLGELAAGNPDTLANLLIGVPGSLDRVAAWGLLSLLFTLLFGAAYNLFAGGLLSVFAGTRSFWAGSLRTFWSFTTLGLLLVLLAVIVSALSAVLASSLGLGALVLAFVLFQLVNLLGEVARALAVVRDRRNPLALLGGALRLCLGRPGLFLLALLGLGLDLLIALLYALAARALGPSPWLPLFQQLALLSWLWVKALRLAWAVTCVLVAK